MLVARHLNVEHASSYSINWAQYNRDFLAEHILYATGTAGTLSAHELALEVHSFQSGSLGGDLQIGAKITERELDSLIFFWDPFEAKKGRRPRASTATSPGARLIFDAALLRNGSSHPLL
jgi:methylglyoxal synthase